MSVRLVSVGRITELLPNHYVLGSDDVANPANSDLVLTIAGANDEANLQHFYLVENTDIPPNINKGVLATYHLKFVLQVTTTQDSGGYIVKYVPVPPDDPIVHGAKYPKWVTNDMIFTLNSTGEERTFKFVSSADFLPRSPDYVLDVRYSQDTTNNFVIVFPDKNNNDPNQEFQTQNPVPPPPP